MITIIHLLHGVTLFQKVLLQQKCVISKQNATAETNNYFQTRFPNSQTISPELMRLVGIGI